MRRSVVPLSPCLLAFSLPGLRQEADFRCKCVATWQGHAIAVLHDMRLDKIRLNGAEGQRQRAPPDERPRLLDAGRGCSPTSLPRLPFRGKIARSEDELRKTGRHSIVEAILQICGYHQLDGIPLRKSSPLYRG